MLDISDAAKDGIINDLISNKLEILFPNGEFDTITEANIESESMTLKQSICDESKLKFGGCIASEFQLVLLNTTSRSFTLSALNGCWIKVKLTQTIVTTQLLPSASLYTSASSYPAATEDVEWYIFNGTIDSAERDKSDRNRITITAYDILAQFYDEDATNDLLDLWQGNDVAISFANILRIIREKFPSLNIVTDKVYSDTEADYKCYNDVWVNAPDKISYGELLCNFAEMLGAFAFIQPGETSTGTLKFVRLSKTSCEQYDFYEDFYAEDKDVEAYQYIDFSEGGSSRTAKIVEFEPSSSTVNTDRHYDMTDNVLVWQENDNQNGAWIHQFQTLFNGNSGTRIQNSAYTPFEATLDGRLWVEVGDMIKIKSYVTDPDGAYTYDSDGNAKTERVTSYVLSRELSGIQALTDKITVK